MLLAPLSLIPVRQLGGGRVVGNVEKVGKFLGLIRHVSPFVTHPSLKFPLHDARILNVEESGPCLFSYFTAITYKTVYTKLWVS